MNYEVEQKRHWRYWVWKRIAENCGVHPSFATVLFLSGPSPSDLQAATKYGFKLRNIVAVDMNAECVEAARKAGCTAIQGSLHEVVAKWTDGTIHGVVADYCCGLTLKVAIDSLQIAAIANAFAFNFQRGREGDSSSAVLREFYGCKNRAELFKLWTITLWRMKWYFINYKPECFSGFEQMFFDPKAPYSQAGSFIRSREKVFNAYFHELTTTSHITRKMADDTLLQRLLAEMQTYSYRSNKVMMDTIVGKIEHQDVTKAARLFWHTSQTASIDRRLAATKAIRTMNGAIKMHAANN